MVGWSIALDTALIHEGKPGAIRRRCLAEVFMASFGVRVE